jgi:hypothetical protein
LAYEQQFIAARKAYQTKIKDMAPSRTLTTFIEEEKPKILAQKLDQINGKPFSEMDAALNIYEAYRLNYIKKINTQIAKEPQVGKLKPTVASYATALEKISEDFGKDCEAKRKAEAEKVEPKPESVVAKSTTANQAAGGAVKMMLTKISEEFRKRRQKHLDVAIEVEKYSTDQRKAVGVLHETLQKEVTQAVNYSRGGQVREAAGLKIASQGQLNKLRNTARAAKKFYDDSLEPFFKERNMKGADVAKELGYDIPDPFLKDLGKISAIHSKIFTTATAHTATAKRLNEECAHLAEDAESLASQIVDIADGKDFGKIFLDGAVKMSERVKGVIDNAIIDAEKLERQTIPGVTTHAKIVEDQAPPERVEASQTSLNTLTAFLKTTMNECIQSENGARSLINAEKKKIPPELLRGQTGTVMTLIEQHLQRLAVMNHNNAEAARPLLVRAEKLVK